MTSACQTGNFSQEIQARISFCTKHWTNNWGVTVLLGSRILSADWFKLTLEDKTRESIPKLVQPISRLRLASWTEQNMNTQMAEREEQVWSPAILLLRWLSAVWSTEHRNVNIVDIFTAPHSFQKLLIHRWRGKASIVASSLTWWTLKPTTCAGWGHRWYTWNTHTHTHTECLTWGCCPLVAAVCNLKLHDQNVHDVSVF